MSTLNYNIPAAILAGSVLYGLSVMNRSDDRQIKDPQPDVSHNDLVQDMRSSGIPIHMISASSDYNALRTKGPADAENVRGARLEDIHDWSTRVLETKKLISREEVFNSDRVSFLITDSNIKPTTVHTTDGRFPGVSEHYAFSFATGYKPKIGRNEDPY